MSRDNESSLGGLLSSSADDAFTMKDLLLLPAPTLFLYLHRVAVEQEKPETTSLSLDRIRIIENAVSQTKPMVSCAVMGCSSSMVLM